MRSSLKQLGLLSAVLIGVFAANSATAMADFSPPSTNVTFTSTSVQFIYSGTTIRCTSATMTGRTPARGTSAISLSQAFSGCTSPLGAATITCSGTITFRITAFDRATGTATGTLDLDAGFNCTITIPSSNCTITLQGAQAGISMWGFTNLQIMRNAWGGLAMTDSGGPCSGNTRAGTRGAIGSFSGTYAPTIRITVS